MISPLLKFQSFTTAVLYIHFSLASFSLLVKKKSLSSLNLSLFLHDVSVFWLEPDTSGISSLYFAHTWKNNLEGARIFLQSWHFQLESFQLVILYINIICRAKQWTSFYMITASVMSELNVTAISKTVLLRTSNQLINFDMMGTLVCKWIHYKLILNKRSFFNLSDATCLFPYPLKTSKNRRRGCRK